MSSFGSGTSAVEITAQIRILRDQATADAAAARAEIQSALSGIEIPIGPKILEGLQAVGPQIQTTVAGYVAAGIEQGAATGGAGFGGGLSAGLGAGLPGVPAVATSSGGFFGGAMGGMGGMRGLFLAAAAIRGVADTGEALISTGEAIYQDIADPFGLTDKAKAEMYHERLGADGRIVRDQNVLQMGNTTLSGDVSAAQGYIKKLPLFGSAGEGIARFEQATANYAVGRGFESEIGYGERTTESAKVEEEHTKIIEEQIERRKHQNEAMDKETEAIEKHTEELGKTPGQKAAIEAQSDRDALTTLLQQAQYHYSNNPNNSLTQGAVNYRDAQLSGIDATESNAIAQGDYQIAQATGRRTLLAQQGAIDEAVGQGHTEAAKWMKFQAEQKDRKDAAMDKLASVTHDHYMNQGAALGAAREIARKGGTGLSEAEDLISTFTASDQATKAFDEEKNRSNDDLREHTLELGLPPHEAARKRLEYQYQKEIDAASGDPERQRLLASDRDAEIGHLAGSGIRFVSPLQGWLGMQNAGLGSHPRPGQMTSGHGIVSGSIFGQFGSHSLPASFGGSRPTPGFRSIPIPHGVGPGSDGVFGGSSSAGFAAFAHMHDPNIDSEYGHHPPVKGGHPVHGSDQSKADAYWKAHHNIDNGSVAHNVHVEAASQIQSSPGWQARVKNAQEQDRQAHEAGRGRIEDQQLRAAMAQERAAEKLSAMKWLNAVIVGG